MKLPKYKAWHIAEKKMCNVTIINFEKGAFLEGVTKGTDQILAGGRYVMPAPDEGRFCAWPEFKLLPFTGFVDSEKNELFKGDLIEDAFVSEIIWSEDEGRWMAQSLKTKLRHALNKERAGKSKKIGNIFQ